MNQEGGFTRQYRRMWDNPVFRNHQEAAVFSWMKDVARWRETTIRTKFGPVTLGVGEFLMAEREVAENFGLHRNTLRNLVQRMADAGMITRFQDRCPQNAGTIVRIVNYKEYQGIEGDSGPLEDRCETADRTALGPLEDRSRTKIKERKESKEGEGEGIDLTADAPTDQPDEEGLAVSPPANDNPAQKPGKQKRGTRVPDGDLPDEWAVAANRTREEAGGLPLLNRRVLALRWAAFQDYWRGVAGSNGLKRDWLATWRNDCRNPMTDRKFPAASLPAAANGQPAKSSNRTLADLDAIPLFFDTPTATSTKA